MADDIGDGEEVTRITQRPDDVQLGVEPLGDFLRRRHAAASEPGLSREPTHENPPRQVNRAVVRRARARRRARRVDARRASRAPVDK